MIEPGATLGVLGGGQLGRMFALAAREMGYGVAVWDPDPQSPCAAVADWHLCASYDDAAALEGFVARCAAATVEFENVPARLAERLAPRLPLRPGPRALAIAQDRRLEKAFCAEHGLPTARFAVIEQATQIEAAVAHVGLPAILKTAREGYDGKGQRPVGSPAEAVAAFAALGGVPCVLEERVELAAELSVLFARGVDGATACYPVIENRHRNGILELSQAPARIPATAADEARHIALGIGRALDYVGVMAVEFFLDREGRVRVNEFAPRPHNSGHLTQDACATSQFEQQVRSLAGLPLGEAQLLAPAAMVNVLGDAWRTGTPPWAEFLREPGVHLHLYGKREARPGRKMGHLNCVGEGAVARAEALCARLRELAGD